MADNRQHEYVTRSEALAITGFKRSAMLRAEANGILRPIKFGGKYGKTYYARSELTPEVLRQRIAESPVRQRIAERLVKTKKRPNLLVVKSPIKRVRA